MEGFKNVRLLRLILPYALSLIDLLSCLLLCITMVIISEPNAVNDSSIKMIKNMHVFQFHICFKHGVSVTGLKKEPFCSIYIKRYLGNPFPGMVFGKFSITESYWYSGLGSRV